MNKEVSLTPHEIRLLQLLADGHNFQSIAETLGLSPNKAVSYMRNIDVKLGLHSKIEAMVYTVRHHLIE